MYKTCNVIVFVFYCFLICAVAQDYEVTDIQCTYSIPGSAATISKDTIAARLKKPEGFKGHPLFADDRTVDAESDPVCQIRPDLTDTTGMKYNLRISDFGRCGVLKRNGYVHVRVWFPQFPGVVMQADQELIIMCKPPEPTVVENKAAGFAGSFPHGARVSGVVEETPGRLEYEVALYKEAPATRLSSNASLSNELPVDQAVPIDEKVPGGKVHTTPKMYHPVDINQRTKLQLRARISPDSAWKYVKLMEVTVSPDPDDPHALGSVALVKEGCRNRDFASIIPHQPARYRERHNEVFLDFEAFLLSTMKERSTLWIHSQIKACMDSTDCQPDFCLDLFEPAGHGKRKRRNVEYDLPNIKLLETHNLTSDVQQFTKILGNLEYTVLMPGEFYHKSATLESSCSTFLAIAAILGCLLFLSAFIMCWLATRLHTALLGAATANKNIDDLVRETRHYSETCYTGRATTQ